MMKGRRLPLGTFPSEPGDYMGPIMGYNGDKPGVFFLKPNARDEGVPAHARSQQHVISPPHEFHENPDGSLTITPSISDLRGDHAEGSDGWHGFLIDGHWVKV